MPASLGGSNDSINGVSAFTITGLNPQDAQQVRQYPVKDGRFLQPADDLAVVIPETVATLLKINVGDTLTIPSAQGKAVLQVVGFLGVTFSSGTEDIYVNLPTAQRLLNMDGQINTIEVLYQPGVDQTSVQTQVLKNLDKDFQTGQAEVGTDLLASLKYGEVAFYIFGVMALGMASFIIYNTFRTVVAERRHDLGLLRAIGASRRTVVGIFVFESFIQGVVGTALGMFLGYLLAAWMLNLIGPMLATFMHSLSSWPIYSSANVIFTIIVGVGFTLLSGFLPALAAARTAPLEALRPVIGSAYEKVASRNAIIGIVLVLLSLASLVSGNFQIISFATLLVLVGVVLLAPVLVQPVAKTFGSLLGIFLAREGRVAQANLVRQPGRAAVTASTMMIALAVIIALAGLMSSITIGFTSYLDRSLGADLLVMPQSLVLGGGNLGASPKLSQELSVLPGIQMVTSLRLANTQTKGSSLQVIGINPITYPQVSGLVFSRGSNAAYTSLGDGRAIIVNGIFSVQNKVQLGDILTLQTPEGDQQYTVVGVGMDYLNSKLATAYISQANLERDFHENSDLLLMANISKGSNATEVKAAVAQLVSGYPAFTLLDALTFKDTSMKAFNDAMLLLYAFMAVLAAPALVAMVNTLAINVIERTREIGMLRALGSSRGMIRGMILAESLLLAILGTGLGILIGLWMGYVLVGTMNVAGFVMQYEFPYVGILIGIAVGLIFGVLAALIPARQAARMDIVTALRYE
jgi:putative ABC transport system permease protein